MDLNGPQYAYLLPAELTILIGIYVELVPLITMKSFLIEEDLIGGRNNDLQEC